MTYGIMIDFMIEKLESVYDWWVPRSRNIGIGFGVVGMISLIGDAFVGFKLNIYVPTLIFMIGAISYYVIAKREGLA